MAEEHDKTHRLIFSFPRMIEDLIRVCLGGDWVDHLDFSTLEKVPERLLSPELLRREQDVLWRVASTKEADIGQEAAADLLRRVLYWEEVLERQDFVAG